jgi:hypothetical protein
MEAAIEVAGLRKWFGPTLALDGMTFTVSPGQVTGVGRLPDCYSLAPRADFAVLCGYAALAMGRALFLLRRRDV